MRVEHLVRIAKAKAVARLTENVSAQTAQCIDDGDA